MPKLTLSIVRMLLSLVLKSFEKVVALIISIIDLVDDGVVNNSYECPKWLDKMRAILHICKDVIDHLTDIEDEIDSDPVDRSVETPEGHA